MSSGSTNPGKGFKIFAIAMVAFMILGSVIVFGGSVFGSGRTTNGGDTSADATIDPSDGPSNEDIQKLEAQVTKVPDDIDSVALLASIYANNGQVDMAIPLYEKALDARPDDGGLRLSFGIALFRNGSTFDAEVQMNQAYELEPNKSGPAYYLGQLQENRDDPDLDSARDWYQKAIDADPESLVAEQAQARLDALNNPDATATPAQ